MRSNIGLLLAKRAALSAGIEGLVEVERGRRFTFAELNVRANRATSGKILKHLLRDRFPGPATE